MYSWKYPQRTDKVEQYAGVIAYCFDIQSTTGSYVVRMSEIKFKNLICT